LLKITKIAFTGLIFLGSFGLTVWPESRIPEKGAIFYNVKTHCIPPYALHKREMDVPAQKEGTNRLSPQSGKGIQKTSGDRSVRTVSQKDLHSADMISWPQIHLEQIVQGLDRPLHITHAGDGSGRLFIIEQKGLIQIFQNGQLSDVPFLDIQDLVKYGGEQGLLCMVFPPGYSAKGYFYVNYTRSPDGRSVVSRFFLIDADRADEASEEVLLTVDQPYTNHNGGQMAFSPIDGFLYIGLGDGGSGGDPQNNAQNKEILLGKILRIDTESGHSPYAVPNDNPFFNSAQALPQIWALGLRNPWRFSFDRQTGDLYIADVGQNEREEIDFQRASSSGGENYGWNILEGTECYSPPSGCVPPASYVAPIVDYSHDQGCSVTGGFVYRGSTYPSMQGIYFYGDFCSGTIWGLRNENGSWEHVVLLETDLSISSFGEDEKGELYLADIAGGGIHRIVTERKKSGYVRR
jgi:glucose/arabinose dehydrogenase